MPTCKVTKAAKAERFIAWQVDTWLSGWLGCMGGCIVGLGRRLLMVHSLGQDIHLAFQQLALIMVAIAQVIPLKTLVIGVEVVRNTAVSPH